MNSMTLLRAMSAIDPQDMEAALNACTAANPDRKTIRFTRRDSSEAVSANGTVLPKQSEKAGRRIAVGGWAAAAACVALITAAGLYFRRTEDDLMFPTSEPESAVIVSSTASVPPLHEQTTGTVLSGTDITTEAPVIAAGTVAAGSQTDEVPEASTEPAGTTESDMQETTATEAESAPETEMTTAPSANVPRSSVPVLIAMADGSGTLVHEDARTPLYEPLFYITSDASEIDHALNGSDPVFTVGTGRKSEETVEGIRSAPQMIHISWQMPDNRWTSYGIRQAEVSPDGTLQMDIAMYSYGEAEQPENWIYHTALLAKAGDLDSIKDVKLNLSYYTDTEETGIRNYMLYQQSLAEDVWLSLLPE
ncbi:MAG: hypothetical protein IKI77_00855 [Oscillospiraceae bacterium]|nr:hypothetical protein [Oscillospiraceae bacterium]